MYSKKEIRAIADWIDSVTRVSREGVRDVGAMGAISEGQARLLAPQL
ncbi:MAG: hypothetical protein ACM3NI_00735 [Bacteroidota bacterium]